MVIRLTRKRGANIYIWIVTLDGTRVPDRLRNRFTWQRHVGNATEGLGRRRVSCTPHRLDGVSVRHGLLP